METKKIVDALNRKGIRSTCPFCGKNNWDAGNDLYSSVRIDEKGNINLGGPVVPMIQLICMDCGFIAQFNPIVLGLIKSQ